MSDAQEKSGNGGSDRRDLTAAVTTARRGLRRDVVVLVESLDHGELFVPLARSIGGVPYGEQMELDDELSLVPHLLRDADGMLYCVLFTRAELLERAGDDLGWKTGEDALEYCAIPARLAFDMAVQVIDGDEVQGLVMNALHDSELFLKKHEVSSIASLHAIPLVGYVSEIPLQEDERTLIAEAGDPPPPELTRAIDSSIALVPAIKSYRLERTFNPDRDLEPHPTLTLCTSGPVDRAGITSRLVAAIEDKLPPPGYIDIVFEEALD